ncbi:hypothetical protein MtrunA17_Chr2g0279861 [Medicago truncatula]|uniref:Uncharacterized protein n=1 Tax=Medicago truncatula TaxID=3880 RepID=A0A396J123_MEDTR|nr:hypothetical protein MtrunA17_Chr2g0279861 [Medicago truncatula]
MFIFNKWCVYFLLKRQWWCVLENKLVPDYNKIFVKPKIFSSLSNTSLFL